MTRTRGRTRRGVASLVAIAPALGLVLALAAGVTSDERLATGTFDVEITPAGEPDDRDGVAVGRSELRKRYHGDLEGEAYGEMLTVLTPQEGSAGYVAVERVTGALHGRAGSFALQHDGLMDRGAQELSIVVVPGSGTGDLVGLAGRMTIAIEGGTHAYTLRYRLPDPEDP